MSAQPGAAAAKKILAVDDDFHTRTLLVDLCESAGFEVFQATDGEEALAWVPRWESGETKPAVILLDLKLPKIDGLAVLKTLKAHAVLRRIPVVVLTTSGEDCDIQAAYDLGANSYIIKPVGFDNFMNVAQQIELYWCVLNELNG